ncbi:filamentous hemagglutinin family protein [Methylomonas sp. MED-D]|uniref:filamentous haemagglutinin family protein n=1 Tax=unclassified Methylomonas TaxID=2608980 RepID=UPI0028A57068|nr:filamentous haemagglutinin family protein [Methylomonas sp. MV1]MDT4329365.1 filamentous hemagglutinin family protein [Methylomonas sp. MV1]
MTNKPSAKSQDVQFRLKPLAARVSYALAGGLLVGNGAALAELPIPAAAWISSGSAQAPVVDGNTMVIKQLSDKAVLNWQKFNVGKENTVKFEQPGTSSIALNKINDPDQDPSRIMGQIVANGQIYLYNKNGFIFDKDSVVNVNSFIATTLKVTDEAWARGITRVYDESKGAALVIEPKSPDDKLDPKTAEILINAGAKITTDKAGRIIIAAPKITNEGTVSAGAQGQIIMAASEDKVYLQAADDKSPFAGLLVEVGTGGKVTNRGDISVRQGNVTLAGFAVNQEGRVSATTSVNVNGSIRLIAREKIKENNPVLLATQTVRDNAGDGAETKAKVRLGDGSVTEVVADSDGGSAIDEQTQPASYIEIGAHTVALESGSTIHAPGATVAVNATDTPENAGLGKSGRILIDKNAKIDVAGYKNVKVAMERNVGEISVQSYDLRDSPLQRGGILKGKTVYVDLRKGTELVDDDGALARISRTVEERLGTGGKITLTSGGDVIANDGSQFDISGGSLQYQDGYIKTTKLLTSYGEVVDISDADPTAQYAGVFGSVEENHAKWGASKTWNLLGSFGKGVFEKGYTEGLAAGSLNISAPRLAWGGTLTAGSEVGVYQRASASAAANGSFEIDLATFQDAQKTLQNVQFVDRAGALALALNDEFPKNGETDIDLKIAAATLTRSGVGNVSVKTRGDASLDTDLAMGPGGKLSVEATNIAVNGDFKAAGGALNLQTDISAVADGVDLAQQGRIVVASGVKVDVSGAWVNDLRSGLHGTPTDPLLIDGGKVVFRANGDVLVNKGAKILADGGAWLPVNGNLRSGRGGEITLAAEGSTGDLISTLTLAGEISAYGLEQNGVLNLTSGKILVGLPDAAADVTDTLVLGTSAGSFDLSKQLAFREINLSADFGGLTVKRNVDLNLSQRNLVLTAGYQNAATGSSIRRFSRTVELADHLRQSVTLTLKGYAGVVMETGSRIVADTGSTIGLTATAGSVFIDGALKAAAGKINLIIDPAAGLQYDPTQTIWLGNHASLDARGVAVKELADAYGNRGGQVLDGGTIAFDAKRGAVVIAEGAVLDVSGTVATVDVERSDTVSAAAFVKRTFASNAGNISIKAADGIVIDGEMRAYAGSASMHGGRLSLRLDRSELNRPEIPVVPFPDGPLVINVSQSGKRQSEEDLKFGDAYPEDGIGFASIGADQISAGGFTDLSLAVNGTLGDAAVAFVGDVNLTAAERIHIDAAELRAVGSNGADAGSVVLNTTFLELGSDKLRTIADSAETGSGQFAGNAQWIQLTGASLWNGFQKVTLNSAHDIRTIGVREESDEQRDYVGALVTAGDLYLHASQVYPSTLTDFTFAVRGNPDGKIVISGTNTDATPLSAAGSLTFEAPLISQQGVVKAPLGKITFQAGDTLTLASGSVTSVSGIDRLTATELLIPFGVVQGGTDWLYTLDNVRNLVWGAAPEKRIVMDAPEIDVASGSLVDLAGGGDLLAYEFIPGAGGSYDYLTSGSGSYQGGFAILPTLGSLLSPYDHYQSSSFDYSLGATIHLEASGDLPAGDYAILPAHYALLPGAYLITPVADTQDQVVTQYTPDGRTIVSGYFAQAGGSIRDARSSGFLIETGADVRKYSEYQTYTANSFYQERAKTNETATPNLPMDGGQVSLIAQTRLVMEGEFMLQALQGGRGARMDIAANNIRIVADRSGEAAGTGVLEILADDLSALNVESLLLGGARDRDVETGETAVDVSADSVVFAEGVNLRGGEIIAAAKNLVEVRTNVSLDADRRVVGGDSVFNLVGNGALLRLSGGDQIELNRTETDGSAGDLLVAKDALLHAAASMLLDASHSTELQGDIRMEGGSLNLAANSVNLGAVDGLAGGALNLTNAKLAQLNVDELVLTARDSLGFYGNVDWRGERLAINAAGMTGHGAAGDVASISAGTLVLANSGAAENLQTVDGGGRLAIVADRLETGAGRFSILGFDAVDVNASEQVRATGDGELRVAADLRLATGGFGADGGASLNIDASGHAAEFAGLTGNAAIVSGYGAELAVTADNIDFDSRVVLPSGALSLHALSGDVSLGEHAQLDLAGRAVKFGDVEQYSQGGRFSAVADHGGIAAKAGSLIDVDSGGGDAEGGNVEIRALEKSASLQGELQAKSGSATVEVGEFAAGQGFDALTQKLNGAGIDRSIYIRVGQADIVQSQSGSVRAEQVTLVADTGSIELAGTVNADAADAGGSIKLYAGDDVVLNAGATLSARGTGDGAKGGSVLLSSVDSDGDGISGVAVGEGSQIDVHGTGAEGGDVTLRALRDGNGVRIQPVAGSVSGYKTFYAEGVAKYANADLGDDGRIDAADIAKIKADTAAYMTEANMAAVADRLGQGIRLLAGVEIDYSGDLTLKDKWDLADWRYDENSDDNVWDDVPGRLVIRASGDFTLDQSLSDGFKNVTFQYDNFDGTTKSVSIIDKLQSGASWSYQLTAGGDLTSADSDKTSGAGDLTLTSNVKVRTGTGDIQLNAGGDIVISGGDSATNRLASTAAKSSTVLAVSDASAWKAGGYLSGSGIVAGTYITDVAAGGIAHATSASAINRSLSLRLGDSDASGWRVGDYLTGNGIASGTTITGINPAGVAAQTTALAAKNTKSLKVADVGGWVVGDYLSGNGVAAGTQITAINVNTKTVTINNALTAAVSANSTLTTLPSVHLSTATTKIMTADTAISTLPTVTLSQATSLQIANNTQLTATYTPASIYSAGTTTQVAPYGTLSDRAVALFAYSEYPVDGGNVGLAAAGNIQGTVSNNNYNDWLLRIGQWSDQAQEKPTAWGVALGYIPGAASNTQPGKAPMPLFQQNVGAFGGGAVKVTAGGDINDLEVVMPTTGKQVGDANGSPNLSGFNSNQVEVGGGGTLAIQAGGNVNGGVFYVGQGEGSLSAGGSIGGGSQFADGPVLLMGDTRFDISAGNDLSLAGVTDPMIADDGEVNFFSYGADSGLTLATLAGDIGLYSSTSKLISVLIPTGTNEQQSLAALYPGSLNATAFGGDIVLNDEIILFPAATGSLNLLAEGDISAADLTDRLGVSDADPALAPGATAPLARTSMADLAGAFNPLGNSPLAHAATPIHAGDKQPARLVTRSGDIKNIELVLATKVLVDSGHDILNLAVSAQHANVDDASLIKAARDIRFSSARNANGSLLDNSASIEIGGSGEVLVKAGRDIDLGASNGISTVGDVTNANLPDQGANLTVMAGVGGEIDYANFIEVYLQGPTRYIQTLLAFADYYERLNNLKNADLFSDVSGAAGLDAAKYQKLETLISAVYQAHEKEHADARQAIGALVTDFMRTRTGEANLSEADALTAFASLSNDDLVAIEPQLSKILMPLYFQQIQSTSGEAVIKVLGESKVQALFPGATWKTDLGKALNVLGYASEAFLFPGAATQSKLIDATRSLTGDTTLTSASALEAFRELPTQQVAAARKTFDLIKTQFFSGLKSGDGALAESALQALFPEGDWLGADGLAQVSFPWQGNLRMVFSKMHTLDGGNINLLVPGGEVNAGLAVSFQGAKPASDLGIVVQRAGSVNAFVRDNFQVNTSRVFALDGGDIMLWSSKGNIDAGRGAKSAISAPAPKISFDEKGNMVIEFPPVVSGSGIRTAGSSEGVVGGDVYLFAPQGVVDAGEAGIGGTNVTISATAVLGAQNIQVSGISTGVPVASVGSVAAGLTGTSNLTAGVSQMAESTVGGDVAGKNTAAAIAKAILGILSVEILGFGD